MEKTLSAPEAWADFWAWIRQDEQQPIWSAISRRRKQYLHKAEIDHRAGRLGYERIKNILLEHAPERYTFTEKVTLNT